MVNKKIIPFNRPYLTGKEFVYVEDSIKRGHISGDGYYTGKASELLEQILDGGELF